MLFKAALLASVLSATAATAAPQGSWPEEMRASGLPKQNWIMVIPARREADGSVLVWDRDDPWTKQWTVPKATPGGTRTVAINGDAEDRRIVSAAQIDNMSVSSLSTLAGKYGASAIAVVVADGEGAVAVAAWAHGNYATWDEAPAGTDMRAEALATLDALYSGAKPAAVDDDGRALHIAGQRFNAAKGTMEYRIEASQDVALDQLGETPSLEVTGRDPTDPPSIRVVVTDGREIAQVLTGAGFVVK